jgi:hypothetical protein
MKKLIPLFVASIVAHTAQSASFTNSVSVDAFVRAGSPTSNYGGAGANAVSGTISTNALGVSNGAFDSFIRFNTASMVSSFNSAFGANIG